MASRLGFEVLGEADYAEWTAFVAQASGGSLYATPAYLDTLCRAAGGDFRIAAVRRGEELAAGVALYIRQGIGGSYVAPRLLLYYNGPVVRDFPTKYPSQETAKQVAALDRLAEGVDALAFGAVTIKGRSPLSDVRPFLDRGWTAAPAYSYTVPLNDLETQWQRVEQNLRRLINRCEQEGYALSHDDDIDGFYRLHVETLERKGAPPYLPPAGFRTYAADLLGRGDARFYHVRDREGRILTSQLVLTGGHPVSHTVCAAADPAARSSGVTPFLRWRAFEALAALGLAANDLTDAALNPVTHFKGQFGGSLELSLVLSSRPRVRFQAVESLTRMAGGARSLASRAARRLGLRAPR